MRFFIALDIPEENKKQLVQIQHQLQPIIPHLRFTDSEKLHLTFAFVGEQSNQLKDPLIEVLTQSAVDIAPFSVTPAYLDGFPNIHQPRVVWAGVKGDIDKLFLIRERIKDGLIKLNLDADERRFVPHITLGKVSDFHIQPEQETELQEIMSKDFLPINVSSIKLFESVPNQGFHQHNILAEIPLIEANLPKI